jgi:hypothetical protein
MNMNNSPTQDELQALIRGCDDAAGSHILWVNHDGEVQISLITDETPASSVRRNEKNIKFRYESYGANNDYVGENAANDEDYVRSVFNQLLVDWNEWKRIENREGGISVLGTNKMIGYLMTLDLEQRQVAGTYLDDVMDNMFRVSQLLMLYDLLKKNSDFSPLAALEDILRLTVVFIHSTVEEFLRRLAINLLPNADKKALNNIPLASESGRAEKFLLGNLVEFKDKTVEEVIKQSVEIYYERSNFNDTQDISNLFSDLGIDIKKFNSRFSKLNELMKRRHFIVHRADKMRKPNESLAPLSPINPREVTEWLNIVTEFCGDVFEEVFEKGLLQ